MIKDNKADSLRTISIPERTPYKMWIKNGKFLKYLFNEKKKLEYFNLDRRKLPKVYWHDGLVDIIRAKTIFNFKNVTGKKIIYAENKNKFLIDIDDKHDLNLANLLLKEKIIKINVNR